MKPKIYEFVFSALKGELEERGYSAREVKTLMENYSWFLSEYWRRFIAAMKDTKNQSHRKMEGTYRGSCKNSKHEKYQNAEKG